MARSESATAVLLPAVEDRDIWAYFASLAFPREEQVRETLAVLAEDGAVHFVRPARPEEPGTPRQAGVAAERMWELLGSRVVVGELDQARGALASDETVVDLLVAHSGMEPVEARTLLAKFGLKGPRASRAAADLSPGERTRAVLAMLMARGTNLLVLDEPTNHLDMPAIEQLEDALAGYDGTLLLVSHDRRLLDAVTTTRTWSVDDGSVTVTEA